MDRFTHYLCNLCFEPEIFILRKAKRLSQRLNLIVYEKTKARTINLQLIYMMSKYVS